MGGHHAHEHLRQLGDVADLHLGALLVIEHDHALRGLLPLQLACPLGRRGSCSCARGGRGRGGAPLLVVLVLVLGRRHHPSRGPRHVEEDSAPSFGPRSSESCSPHLKPPRRVCNCFAGLCPSHRSSISSVAPVAMLRIVICCALLPSIRSAHLNAGSKLPSTLQEIIDSYGDPMIRPSMEHPDHPVDVIDVNFGAFGHSASNTAACVSHTLLRLESRTIHTGMDRLFNIDQVQQVWGAAGYMRAWWYDPRFRFNATAMGLSEIQVNPSLYKHTFWRPALFFEDLEQATGPDDEYNLAEMIRIHSDGIIFTSKQVRLRFKCAVDLTRLPFDTQHCTYTTGMFDTETNQVRVRWRPGLDALDQWQQHCSSMWAPTALVQSERLGTCGSPAHMDCYCVYMCSPLRGCSVCALATACVCIRFSRWRVCQLCMCYDPLSCIRPVEHGQLLDGHGHTHPHAQPLGRADGAILLDGLLHGVDPQALHTVPQHTRHHRAVAAALFSTWCV